MRRNAAVWTTALLLGVAFVACASRQPMRGQNVTGLDRKLSRFAYIEEGELVTLIVGTRAAYFREESEFIPLEIAIANTGVRALTLTRESFTLIDENGARYPAATPRELIDGYEMLDFDRESMAELESILTTKFAAFQRYPAKFSPTRTYDRDGEFSSNLVRDTVSLPKFGYIIDYVYFPKPQTGVRDHKFELFLDAPELEDAVFVKFAVE